MRAAFVNAICSLAVQDRNLVQISGDLGFGALDPFIQAFPQQFINAGISEQNMTSVAAGLAMSGKCVFTYSIGNFSTFRCLEQIRNDIAYHKANVKIVSVGAGFAYGSAGVSHHATEDISIMRSVPGMSVFTPCDPVEAQAITKAAYGLNGPCYLRLGKGGERTVIENSAACLTSAPNFIRRGREVAILAVGNIITEGIAAAEILAESCISCTVASFPTIKPLEPVHVVDIAQEHSLILAIEEHTIVGGFGGAVAEILAECPSAGPLVRLGMNDRFSDVVGSQDYIRHAYGLDAQSIASIVRAKLSPVIH